jgi:hypothetical protein
MQHPCYSRAPIVAAPIRLTVDHVIQPINSKVHQNALIVRWRDESHAASRTIILSYFRYLLITDLLTPSCANERCTGMWRAIYPAASRGGVQEARLSM